ncbi:MAG: hypothetical protein H7832_11220 [Magnetococcus sp. DMHC-6]
MEISTQHASLPKESGMTEHIETVLQEIKANQDRLFNQIEPLLQNDSAAEFMQPLLPLDLTANIREAIQTDNVFIKEELAHISVAVQPESILSPILQAIHTQSQHLIEKIQVPTFPAEHLELFQTHINQQLAQQEHRLIHTLSELINQNKVIPANDDTLLRILRAEMTAMTHQLEQTIEQKESPLPSTTLEPILKSLQAESAALLKKLQQEYLSQPNWDALRAELTRLTLKPLQAMEQSLTAIDKHLKELAQRDSFSLQPATDTLTIALKDHLENHSLHKEPTTPDRAFIEPILAAIRSETADITQMKQSLATMDRQLKELTQQSSLRSQTATNDLTATLLNALQEKVTQLSLQLQQPARVPDDLLHTLQEHLKDHSLQEKPSIDITLIEPILATIRNENAIIAENLKNRNLLTPILEALREESARLMEDHRQTIQQAMSLHLQKGIDAPQTEKIQGLPTLSQPAEEPESVSLTLDPQPLPQATAPEPEKSLTVEIKESIMPPALEAPITTTPEALQTPPGPPPVLPLSPVPWRPSSSLSEPETPPKSKLTNILNHIQVEMDLLFGSQAQPVTQILQRMENLSDSGVSTSLPPFTQLVSQLGEEIGKLMDSLTEIPANLKFLDLAFSNLAHFLHESRQESHPSKVKIALPEVPHGFTDLLEEFNQHHKPIKREPILTISPNHVPKLPPAAPTSEATANRSPFETAEHSKTADGLPLDLVQSFFQGVKPKHFLLNKPQ